jgi:hypothetical protein
MFGKGSKPIHVKTYVLQTHQIYMCTTIEPFSSIGTLAKVVHLPTVIERS